jgi:hypothetical protein
VGLLVLLVAVGCSGSSPGGTTGDAGHGGPGGAGGGGAAGAGGQTACGVSTGAPSTGASCTDVTAAGPCVEQHFSNATPPAPAGGAFVAGTFNLVSDTFYGPPTTDFVPGAPFRQTFFLSDIDATSFALDQAWASGDVVARSREVAALSGMTATFTQACPSRDAGVDWSGTAGFTATSSSITLVWSRSNQITEVAVYEKAQ